MCMQAHYTSIPGEEPDWTEALSMCAMTLFNIHGFMYFQLNEWQYILPLECIEHVDTILRRMFLKFGHTLLKLLLFLLDVYTPLAQEIVFNWTLSVMDFPFLYYSL